MNATISFLSVSCLFVLLYTFVVFFIFFRVHPSFDMAELGTPARFSDRGSWPVS